MRVRVPTLIAAVAALLSIKDSSGNLDLSTVNGPIAFAGLGADGNFEIFRMQPNGTDVRRLTNARGASIFSDWSPDGRWIAFDSDRTGNVELWLMDRNGGQEHQVTHFRQFAGDPSFSPDGTRLVFEKSPADACCSNIYTVALDGTGLRQLTHFKVETFAFEPEYSPDGRWVAFTLLPPGGHEKVAIYLVRSDGSEIRRVTRQRLDAAHPSWSPDGSRIIFNDRFTGTTGDIFTIRPDGTGLRRLTFVTPKRQVNFRPDYSPDGTKIVFNHLDDVGPGAPVEAWVMNADGSGRRELIALGFPGMAAGSDELSRPSWSPDGSRIAFDSRGGTTPMLWQQTYVMNADGTDPRPLGPDPFAKFDPAWSPDGRRIAVQTYDYVIGDSLGYDNVLASYDVETGERVIHYRPHTQFLGMWGPDYSPDGRTLVFTQSLAERYRILLLDLETGDVRAFLPEAVDPLWPNYFDTDPAWSRTGAPDERSAP